LITDLSDYQQPHTINSLDSLRLFLKDGTAIFKSSFQEYATDFCLQGNQDMIVRLPTGEGKSMLYQLPAFMKRDEGLVTIILSPLRSLIMDQITNLNQKWPNLASELTREMIDGSLNYTALIYMHYNDYSASEKHASFIKKLITEKRLFRVVFDEFQTLILWDRFTNFQQSLRLIRTEPFPLMFLSGSSSPAMIDEVTTMFQLQNPKVFFQASPRKNLKYKVQKDGKLTNLPLISNAERIIVFVASRKGIDVLEAELLSQGLLKEKIFKYHGGMEMAEKNFNQERWTKTDSSLIIATTAFSLGIDYPQVRHVYVLGSAYGLDNLIQMWGRAGRDNVESSCYYLCSSQSFSKTDQEQVQLSRVENYQECLRFIHLIIIRSLLYEIKPEDDCYSVQALPCCFCESQKRKRPLSQELNPVKKKLPLKMNFKVNPVFLKLPNLVDKDSMFDLESSAKLINDKKLYIYTVASFVLGEFNLDIKKGCRICQWLAKADLEHSLSGCSELSKRCLRCCSTGHIVRDCGMKICMTSVHQACGLPLDNLSNITFHVGMDCNSVASDSFIPLLMYLFQTQRQLIRDKAQREFSSDLEYFTWIYAMEYGITHGMDLYYKIFKKD
jgi:superfamily II DNA or RNA helicase